MIFETIKAKARAAFRHRTKILGGLGVAAGSLESWAANHPGIHVPAQGVMLIVLGGLVAIVGTYNTVAQFFGWKDDPTP